MGCWHGYLSGARCRLGYSPADATVFYFSKIQIGFTFLVPAHPGSPGNRAVKQVCVCSICLIPKLYSFSMSIIVEPVNCYYVRHYVVGDSALSKQKLQNLWHQLRNQALFWKCIYFCTVFVQPCNSITKMHLWGSEPYIQTWKRRKRNRLIVWIQKSDDGIRWKGTAEWYASTWSYLLLVVLKELFASEEPSSVYITTASKEKYRCLLPSISESSDKVSIGLV